MKIIICSIYDIKVAAYQRPIFVPATGAATRMFTDEVNRADSEMNKHPEDYALYLLGHFEDETGKVTPVHGNPELLVQAATVIKLPQ